MTYRAIGVMSGSSLDGLDIVFAEFVENAGKWSYEIRFADCLPYNDEWIEQLSSTTSLSAIDYQLLHTKYGHYMGQCINEFITSHQLQFKVALIASHGHTTFHLPDKKMTAQLGDGAAIAAVTQLPVVSDVRALDIAFGGQGAPVVPIGEQLLLPAYACFLNIGGIANISINKDPYTAFDICAANRVLNLLANEVGCAFDDRGALAGSGEINTALLSELNQLDYYDKKAPKSLANSFGTDIVYPIIKKHKLSVPDALRTYTEHIAQQIKNAVTAGNLSHHPEQQMLVTGGGAFNSFLVERIRHVLAETNIKIVVPEKQLVVFKEALIIALMGVLRWREEYTVLSSVTGAARSSIGGAVWMGQES